MILTVKKSGQSNIVQENRLIVSGILSVSSVIYMCVISMALYISIPMWLVVVNIACLFINVPLIWRLLSLYVAQRKRINKSIKE